jgi:hypothetical protein
MLESLGPLERAVFLLREIFDYDYCGSILLSLTDLLIGRLEATEVGG